MKNKFLLLIIFCLVLCIYAQDIDISTAPSPKMHEKFNFNINMNIVQIVDSLNVSFRKFNVEEISIEDFKSHFGVNFRDPALANQSLRRNEITNIDEIYQLYNLRRFGFNDQNTLNDVSRFLQIPFIKLAEYLDLNAQDPANRFLTLEDVNIESIDMMELLERFQQEKLLLSSALTILGLLASFMALSVTALAISQLKHLKSKAKISEPKPITITTPIGKITPAAGERISSDAVIAVIASIHRLNSEIEKENKLFMNWRRANISMWHASGKVNMPTQQYYALKNRR